LALFCANRFNLGAVRNSHHRYSRIACFAGGIGKATSADVGWRSSVDCYTTVGYIFPADDGVSQYEMESSLTMALQATGAAPSALSDVGDSLLPGFVVASFPAPVPELGR